MLRKTSIIIIALLALVSVSCTKREVEIYKQLHPYQQEQVIKAHAHKQPKVIQRVSQPRSVEQMIRDRWPDEHEDRAVRIAKCESGLVATARNRHSSASGVFQMIKAHWQGRWNPFDAKANIEGAYQLWLRSGWRPWVCKG